MPLLTAKVACINFAFSIDTKDDSSIVIDAYRSQFTTNLNQGLGISDLTRTAIEGNRVASIYFTPSTMWTLAMVDFVFDI